MRIILFLLIISFSLPVMADNNTRFKPLKIEWARSQPAIKAIKEQPDYTDITALWQDAKDRGIPIRDFANKEDTLYTTLHLDSGTSAPAQVGEAATLMYNHTSTAMHSYTLQLRHKGLKGPKLTLNSEAVRRLRHHKNRTPNEVWQDTELSNTTSFPSRKTARYKLYGLSFFDRLTSLYEPDFTFFTQIMPSSGKSKILYRSAAILGFTRQSREKEVKSIFFKPFLGRKSLHYTVLAGAHMRMNLKGNLENLDQSKPIFTPGPRSFVAQYDDRTFALEDLYLGLTLTPFEDFHIAAGAGYLEEMLTGMGIETLYRPFGQNYAIGGTAYYTSQRNPYNLLSIGRLYQDYKSYSLRGLYEIPRHDVQLELRAGRYLLGDRGATFTVRKTLDHGGQIEGFGTWTELEDFDNFSGETQAEFGIRYSMPLNVPKPLPSNSRIETRFENFGRDAGQFVDSPFDLVNLTNPISKMRIENDWEEIAP